jgi:hypothetical protein
MAPIDERIMQIRAIVEASNLNELQRRCVEQPLSRADDKSLHILDRFDALDATEKTLGWYGLPKPQL